MIEIEVGTVIEIDTETEAMVTEIGDMATGMGSQIEATALVVTEKMVWI